MAVPVCKTGALARTRIRQFAKPLHRDATHAQSRIQNAGRRESNPVASLAAEGLWVNQVGANSSSTRISQPWMFSLVSKAKLHVLLEWQGSSPRASLHKRPPSRFLLSTLFLLQVQLPLAVRLLFAYCPSKPLADSRWTEEERDGSETPTCRPGSLTYATSRPRHCSHECGCGPQVASCPAYQIRMSPASSPSSALAPRSR